jgi:hypothetical protein
MSTHRLLGCQSQGRRCKNKAVVIFQYRWAATLATVLTALPPVLQEFCCRPAPPFAGGHHADPRALNPACRYLRRQA